MYWGLRVRTHAGNEDPRIMVRKDKAGKGGGREGMPKCGEQRDDTPWHDTQNLRLPVEAVRRSCAGAKGKEKEKGGKTARGRGGFA